MDAALEALLAALLATGRQVGLILGPLAAAAAALHLIESQLTGRLVSRIGWSGVWLTGWLGVPVHELSHAAACVVFGHKIQRMRLFAPDRATGRLGDVRHAFDPKNPWQQAGRFFIGVAPLVGGSLVLWALSATLGPDGLRFQPLAAGPGPASAVAAAVDQGAALLRGLSEPAVLGRWTTWVFLYLCLCVGAHMAPSGTDLKGGVTGLALLLAALFAANLIVLACGDRPEGFEALALAAVAPLLVLLLLALILGVVFLLLVVLLTAPLPDRAGTQSS
ncbi:MAG TPA: hypothetical protein VFD43_03405 [Planctomycetota bacterium]|nr:hypothetical protein [Planctomycetota bacterium]